MSDHLRQITLLGLLLWLTSSLIIVGTPEGIQYSSSSPFFTSETDLNRAEWKMDHYANPGFESWTTDYIPEDLYTTRSTEHYTWYAQAPWPVNEGSRSRGFQTRAIDPDHPAEAYLTRSSWPYWSNPTNLTMKLDWYIENLPQPTDSDYFRLYVQLGSPSTVRMYYYFNSQDTGRTNTSSYMYFFIDGPTETWNTFDRNITADFFEVAGSCPTQFQLFRIELLSATSEYSRAFVDDLWMINGTVIYGGATGNGNFESNAAWYSVGNRDPADISKSSVRQEGDWSLNATSISSGNQSRLTVEFSPDRRLSELNQDVFSFEWRMDDFQGASEDTYAFVYISSSNESDSTDVFYVLCYGDNTNSFTWPGAIIFNVTGFNTTGQWNSFSRSIWSDVISTYETNYLVIDSIEIEIQVRGPSSRISILFDDMKFESAALDDMGYEDQPAVGEMALSWSADSGPTPEFTVTGTVYSGSKAANLTVTDGNSWSGSSQFYNRPLDDTTDLWLDFYWRIEDSSEDLDNLLYLEVYFESEEVLAYIFANYSALSTGNGFDDFIILPDANDVGEWHNFHRNLYDDYVTVFGSAPSTELYELYLSAEADTGGRLSVLFDDVYLFNDPAPALGDIYTTPLVADTDVNVSLTVHDLSSFTVSLFYQVNSGAWNEVAMTNTGSGFNATIPGQSEGTEVDFYIRAVDAFGQTSQSTTIGYTVPEDTTPPPADMLPVIIAVVAVAAVIGVIVLYIYVIKPKQGAD